jgi:DNA polymerase III subunit gamma/tau
LAGAADSGLDYERAVSLLGYTDAALLDDVVEAIAARDGASVFRVVSRVISSGHEPRRFVEDLLERLRDLIVLAASGEAATAVLRGVPADQFERMQKQAAGLGPAELSRSADLVNTALSEMTGATSPRLHLELLAARLLLPGRDDTSVVARLERVERVVDGGGVSGSGASAVSAPAAPRAAPVPVEPPAPAAPAPSRPEPTVEPSAKVSTPVKQTPDPEPAPAPAPEPVRPEPQPDSAPSTGSAAPEAEMVRRRWPEVLEMIKGQSRVTWSLVSANASVGTVEGGVLTLAFSTPQLANNFRTRSQHGDVVAAAIRETLGVVVRVEPEPPGATKPSALASSGAPVVSSPVADTGSRARAQASWDAPAPTPPSSAPPADAPRPATSRREDPAAGTRAAAVRPRTSAPASDGIPDGPEPQDDPGPAPAAATAPARRGRPAPSRAASAPSVSAAAPERAPADGSDASPDDPELAGSGLLGAPLVAKMLGGVVIDEITDEP